MVDMRTYNEMHPSNKTDAPHIDKKRVYLDAKLMAKDQPGLRDEFFLCLPTIIFGYNMQKHEWGNELFSLTCVSKPSLTRT